MSEVHRHDDIQGEIIHEYDGIEEADNALPMWWLLTFYGAIAFSVVYWFYYEEFEIGPHQPEAYATAVAERAASGGEVSEETLLALASDPRTVSTGHEAYLANCVACHGEHGEGVIGPNLTDEHWVHGGSPTDIYAVIRNGVVGGEIGAMPAWGPALGEGAVQAVTAFVLTLRDTNAAGGRPPEGEVYDPAAASAAADEESEADIEEAIEELLEGPDEEPDGADLEGAALDDATEEPEVPTEAGEAEAPEALEED